jgi:hypothetical protein
MVEFFSLIAFIGIVFFLVTSGEFRGHVTTPVFALILGFLLLVFIPEVLEALLPLSLIVFGSYFLLKNSGSLFGAHPATVVAVVALVLALIAY